MLDNLQFEGSVFILSFVFCLLPKAFTRIGLLRKVYPFLTLLAAEFMLAVMLLDFIPHMILGDHKHTHNENHEQKEHTHHDHYHGCHAENEFNSKIGLLISGLSFLFLVAIDTIVLKHNHWEEEKKDTSDCCNNNHNPSLHEKEVEIHVKTHSHEKHSTDQLGCCSIDLIKNSSSKAQAFIYILAISIHSFFEGLAFDSSGDSNSYKLGIIVHKVLESFSIGLTLFSTSFSMLTSTYTRGYVHRKEIRRLGLQSWFSVSEINF